VRSIGPRIREKDDMPLQIQLTGTGPGQGVFDISGGELAGESFELAVQRSSDEKFLGTDLLWQNAPYWHVCYRIDGEPERLRLAAGAEIVDGVVESSVHALRVLVRAGRVQAQGNGPDGFEVPGDVLPGTAVSPG
jgi:hypothetical protein